MNDLIRIIRLPAILAAASLLPPAAAQTALERIQAEGLARIGVANERPYGYVTEGGPAGEGPAVARLVLARIDPDIRLEGVAVRFEELIPQLKAGDYDLVAAGMFITPQRCKEVAFSNPTYVVGQAFAVRAGNPKQLTDYAAVAAHPDARLGFLAGAVEYEYAYEAGLLDPDRSEIYPDPEEALEALRQGEVDAVALSSLSIRALVAAAGDPAIEATEQFFPVVDGEPVKGYGAFAFRLEDQELAAAFNRHLADVLGSDEHRAAVEEYGFAPDMLPDRTAEELCRG